MKKELSEARDSAMHLCISLQKLLVRAKNLEDQAHYLRLSLSGNEILEQFSYLENSGWFESQLSIFENQAVVSRVEHPSSPG